MNPDLDPDPELDFQLFGKSGSVFRSSKTWDHNTYTEKCRFMDKRLREISRFFVAPPRVFPLSICARAHESTQIFIQKYLRLSILQPVFVIEIRQNKHDLHNNLEYFAPSGRWPGGCWLIDLAVS